MVRKVNRVPAVLERGMENQYRWLRKKWYEKYCEKIRIIEEELGSELYVC